MAYSVTLLRNLGLILALITGLGAGIAAADEGPWQVTNIGGGAWLQAADGSKAPLHEGDNVGPGSVLGSGNGGKLTLSRGKTAMTLSPNSEMEIPLNSDEGANTTVFQRSGALLLKVEKRPEQHFQVDTPFLAAVVKGTTFTVSVNDQASAVHVVEGAVEVGAFASGDVALIRPGQTASVSPLNGGSLKVSGLNVPADAVKSQGQQGKADQDSGDTQARSGQGDRTAPGHPSAEDHSSAQGPSSAQGNRPAQVEAKGLTIEKPIGWGAIDIAAVSDGFVAVAVPQGAGLVSGTSAGAGEGDAATRPIVGVVDTAVASLGASGGSAATGSVFGSVGSTAGGAVASVGAAAGGATAAVGATGGGVAGAASAIAGGAGGAIGNVGNGLGGTIHAAAAAIPAANPGQAVSQVVQSLTGNGNNGNGNGNGGLLGGLGLGN